MKKNKNTITSMWKKYSSIAAVLLMAGSIAAQATDAAQSPVVAVAKKSAYEHPAFYALCIMAIILLIYIRQLSKLFTSVTREYVKRQKEKGNNSSGNTLMIVALIASGVLIPASSYAADSISNFLHDGFGSTAFNAIAVIIAFELLAILVLTSIINSFLRKKKTEEVYIEKKTASVWEKLNKSVSVEKEETIMTVHEYDGIRELDNNLPPWWKYGFYLTIVWSVFYLGYYHVFAAGPLQLEEFAIAEAKAEAAMEEYKKYAVNQVDESNVTFLLSPSDIDEGKKLYTDKTCVACHGPEAGGGIGPNLVDNYWMHGGSAADIFKSIKYGIPEKGMKAWQNEITPSQMAQIVAYIHNIRGTNPPGAKEPQGELYAPEQNNVTGTETAADSASVN